MMKTARNTHNAPPLAAAILVALPHLNSIGKPQKQETLAQHSAVFTVTVPGTKATLHLTAEVSTTYQINTAAINCIIYVDERYNPAKGDFLQSNDITGGDIAKPEYPGRAQ